MRTAPEEIVVDNVVIERSTMERMMEMRAKQRARSDSRTEEGSEN